MSVVSYSFPGNNQLTLTTPDDSNAQAMKKVSIEEQNGNSQSFNGTLNLVPATAFLQVNDVYGTQLAGVSAGPEETFDFTGVLVAAVSQRDTNNEVYDTFTFDYSGATITF